MAQKFKPHNLYGCLKLSLKNYFASGSYSDQS